MLSSEVIIASSKTFDKTEVMLARDRRPPFIIEKYFPATY
jgi:hypothetical protein